MKIIIKILRYIKYEFYRFLGKMPLRVPYLKISKKRLGSDYGGWVVAKEYLNAHSVVYSFGVGTDITFDLAMIDLYDLTVYAFDPTPRCAIYINSLTLPQNFLFSPYGVANEDKLEKFYLPSNPNFISHSKTPIGDEAMFIQVKMKKLSSIMNEFGHQKIDVLKMDIEGFEYEIIDDILHAGLDITQILVEFHHDIYPTFNIETTNKAIIDLVNSGYRIFDVSLSGREYSFIKV